MNSGVELARCLNCSSPVKWIVSDLHAQTSLEPREMKRFNVLHLIKHDTERGGMWVRVGPSYHVEIFHPTRPWLYLAARQITRTMIAVLGAAGLLSAAAAGPAILSPEISRKITAHYQAWKFKEVHCVWDNLRWAETGTKNAKYFQRRLDTAINWSFLI